MVAYAKLWRKPRRRGRVLLTSESRSTWPVGSDQGPWIQSIASAPCGTRQIGMTFSFFLSKNRVSESHVEFLKENRFIRKFSWWMSVLTTANDSRAREMRFNANIQRGPTSAGNGIFTSQIELLLGYILSVGSGPSLHKLIVVRSTAGYPDQLSVPCIFITGYSYSAVGAVCVFSSIRHCKMPRPYTGLFLNWSTKY
jgi:hypothetical protein